MAKAGSPLGAMKKDIEQRYNMAVKEFAEEMTAQIEMAYESVIESFYADYKPYYYKRTFYSYYGSDRYDEPIYATPTSYGFDAGIHVGPEYYPDDPYRADTAWVFSRTFKEGIHGFFKGEFNEWKADRDIKIKTEYILNGKKTDLKKFLNEKNAKKPILYRTKAKHMPKHYYIKSIKAKTPMEAMNKSFKHLTTKTNMDRMFNAILGIYFG